MIKLALVTACAVALLIAPTAVAGPSIGVCNGASTTTCAAGPFNSTDGVYFAVGSGGGNRDFASVAVSCTNTGYATVLTVEVPAKGTGTSQAVHPPSGSNCTATLEKLMQIGKVHVLAGPVSFAVA